MAEVNGNLLVKGQHLNLKPERLATDPIVGDLGADARLWFNTTAKALKLFTGDAIIALGEGGGGVSEGDVTDAITSALATYSTTTQMNTAISTATANMATDAELAAAVSGLASTSSVNAAIDSALAGLDFQEDVLGFDTDFAGVAGRYIFLTGAGWTDTAAAAAGDIVEVSSGGLMTALVYDVSVAGPGALAWDRATSSWLRWDGSDWATFGGLTAVTAGNGIDKTGDTISVKAANSSIVVDGTGVKVGDLSATYTTVAALDSAVAAAVGDSIADELVPYAKTADVASNLATALTPYKTAADTTTEITTAVTGLASTASVTSAIDNALSGLDFQSDILGFEADFAGVAGRYIITNGLSGLTAVSGNANDIIEVDAAGLEIHLDYDVSVAGPGALVWNRAAANGGAWYRWNGTDWAVFGGLAGFTASDGLEDNEGTVSVKAANSSIVVDGTGVKVGDLSATYVTPAALATATADFLVEADVTPISNVVNALQTQVGASFFGFSSGATSATTHTVTHNLNYQWPIVQVVDPVTNKTIVPDSIEFTSANELVITLSEAATLRASVSWLNTTP